MLTVILVVVTFPYKPVQPGLLVKIMVKCDTILLIVIADKLIDRLT